MPAVLNGDYHFGSGVQSVAICNTYTANVCEHHVPIFMAIKRMHVVITVSHVHAKHIILGIA